MSGAAEQIVDPAPYPGWVWVLVVVPPLLVLGWYLGVWLWARGTRPRPATAVTAVPPRQLALDRLDQVEAAVAGGEMPLRQAHQEISAVVRGYLTAVGADDVRVLDLEQLRDRGPAELADVVALVYPAEFAPGDEGSPAQRLGPALARARAVVSDG